jgi:hypothetical protein
VLTRQQHPAALGGLVQKHLGGGGDGSSSSRPLEAWAT